MPNNKTDTTNPGLPNVASDWDADREDEWTERINGHHPCNTGDHKTYAKAMELVGNRHSKYALVDLVNFLLRNQARASRQDTSGDIG